MLLTGVAGAVKVQVAEAVTLEKLKATNEIKSQKSIQSRD